MKILIIGTIDTAFEDREEAFCEYLSGELKMKGYETDVCYLPFKRDMINAAEQVFAYSLVNTSRADAIVTVGYPACFVPHHNEKKVCYLFDCYPEIHDSFSFKLREHRVEERKKIVEGLALAEIKALSKARVFMASEELKCEVNARCKTDGHFILPNDVALADRIAGALL